MRIGILGPLEVRDEAGQFVRLGGPRLRALLIRLALDPGRAVAADRLAGDLWPGDGPDQAAPADSGNALQALVSRLRHAAGPGIIEHRAGGYLLAVDAGDVDATQFERAVSEGRAALAAGDPGAGAALLRGALDLWRGPALVDVEDAAFAPGPVARLEELRLAATEDRIEAELALGRGAELAPEAEELATAGPGMAQPWGQEGSALGLALGQQPDRLPLLPGRDVLHRVFVPVAHGALGHIPDVRSEQRVRGAAQRVIEGQRLAVEDIERRARDRAVAEGGEQRRVVDDRPPRGVDEIARGDIMAPVRGRRSARPCRGGGACARSRRRTGRAGRRAPLASTPWEAARPASRLLAPGDHVASRTLAHSPPRVCPGARGRSPRAWRRGARADVCCQPPARIAASSSGRAASARG